MANITKITSRDNARLVHCRKVRDGKAKSQIFVEGKRLAAEAIRSDIEIDECFVTEEVAASNILDSVQDRCRAISIVSKKLFDSIADTDSPQGIILLATRPQDPFISKKIKPSDTSLFVFLHEVNNPSNVGAILRTAEAAGVSGVITSVNSADVYSPKAIRSAMGATFRIPIWAEAEFEDASAWARSNNIAALATAANGGVEYSMVDWTRSRLLIFGSEAHGLSQPMIANVGSTVHIPMENNVESLNLSVSAGIILFEAKRQRDELAI